eukprot:1667349-Rhodomonas_salina.5
MHIATISGACYGMSGTTIGRVTSSVVLTQRPRYQYCDRGHLISTDTEATRPRYQYALGAADRQDPRDSLPGMANSSPNSNKSAGPFHGILLYGAATQGKAEAPALVLQIGDENGAGTAKSKAKTTRDRDRERQRDRETER